MVFVKSSVTLGCTPERTHPLVGCLKRAIDSSKQNQIKTSHLQKETLLLTKQCQEACHMKAEVVQRVVGSTDKVYEGGKEKKSMCF